MDKSYQQIELKKIISIMLKRSWIVASLIFLFAIGSRIISTNYLDYIYKAQTTLFIGKEQGAIGGIGISLSDIQTYNQLIIDYKHIADSRLVIDKVIKNTNINMDINDFKESLSVEIINNSRLFTVSFLHHNPETAAKIANEIAKELTIAAAEIVEVKNIMIIDEALVPTKHVSPNINMITLVSGLIGMIIGLFIIYLIELYYDTLANQESIEEELQLPTIGNIPRNKDLSLISIDQPNSYIAESYRMLRTNINYINIDKENKVILITSSVISEGKTTTISNLAITMAKADKKVLLLEGDLRRPRTHDLFKINQIPGLTNIIYEKLVLSEVIQHIEEVSKLDIITSGVLPLTPAELLGSDAFKSIIENARKIYDVILIDAPPILSVTDAAIISQLVDGVILVVAANTTKKNDTINAKKALDKVGANLMGVILTKIKQNKRDYYNDDYYKK